VGAVDDGGARRGARRDARRRGRAEGHQHLDQPLVQGQDVCSASPPVLFGTQEIYVLVIMRIVKSRVEPRYQETASDDIPVTNNIHGVSVKVIAGECLGARSAVRPRTPAMCLDAVAGEAVFEVAASAVGARTLVVFGSDGEAVVRDGPFVMNSREEVEQAREDYRQRRNGFEMADSWASDQATTAHSS
jgi:quercetin 2,3-dioxygenase